MGKITRPKFYRLENGSMIRVSDIRFTRYTESSYIDKKPRWDVLLMSGPQFVISERDFIAINNILSYDMEEVESSPMWGRPIFESWIDDPEWAKPLMNFKPLPVESNKIGIDLPLDDDNDANKMIVTTDQKIKDMFASMKEDSDGKDSSSLDTYPKPKSYSQF